MNIIDLLILSLATWRLSSLIATPGDDGPWEMFLRFRRIMGVRLDDDTGIYYGTNELARGILCVWCTSVWVGFGLGILYLVLGVPTVYVAFPFALSGAAIIIERIVNG